MDWTTGYYYYAFHVYVLLKSANHHRNEMKIDRKKKINKNVREIGIEAWILSVNQRFHYHWSNGRIQLTVVWSIVMHVIEWLEMGMKIYILCRTILNIIVGGQSACI